MAIPNQKFREIIFQLLYSQDMGKSDPNDLIPMIMNELKVTRKTVTEAQVVVDQILKNINTLDKKIGEVSLSYDFDRIHSVERNILRLGLYELLYRPDLPPKIAIAEAIRLAKKFSTPESTAFVNALLDKMYKNELEK